MRRSRIGKLVRNAALVASVALFVAVCACWLADWHTLGSAKWSTTTPDEPSANGYLISRGGGKVLLCRGCFDEKAGVKVSSVPVGPDTAIEIGIWYCVTGDNEPGFEWARLGTALVIGPADWKDHTWAILCPDWMLLLATAAGPGLWLHHRQRQRRRQRAGQCALCGYDLRASPVRCPECGTTVEQPSLAAPPSPA